MAIVNWKEVIDFWFDPKLLPLHFVEDPKFDEKIRIKFLDTGERTLKVDSQKLLF